MKAYFLPLLKPHHLRVLLALRSHGPMRFKELERLLRLNPAQLDRALGFLSNGVWVLATLLPPEGRRVPAEYSLSKRGVAFLEAFDAFARNVKGKRLPLGSAALAELESLEAR